MLSAAEDFLHAGDRDIGNALRKAEVLKLIARALEEGER